MKKLTQKVLSNFLNIKKLIGGYVSNLNQSNFTHIEKYKNLLSFTDLLLLFGNAISFLKIMFALELTQTEYLLG